MQDICENGNCGLTGQDEDWKNQVPECYGAGASLEPPIAVFPTILDYPGIEEWKRWGPELLRRLLSSDCGLSRSHSESSEGHKGQTKMIRTLNNKSACLSLFLGGKKSLLLPL